LSHLPDECWLRVFSHLEASELSGVAAQLSGGALALTEQHQLWVALLYSDFCASFSQRAVLRTWLALHQRHHPRDLYIHKHQEHLQGLGVARAELWQRAEQVREQDRKQRRLRAMNFVLVRLTHLLLCACALGSSALLWLRLDGVVDWPLYVVFTPVFVFEAFLLVSLSMALVVYCNRSSGVWTFYWNRLRGGVKGLILYTSPQEAACVVLLLCSAVPLLVGGIEGDAVLPRPYPRLLLPFVAVWTAALCLGLGVVRRRPPSASCVGSFVLLWLPLVSLSVLLFLRCSVMPQMPSLAVFAPGLVVTGLALVFVGFLVVAACWLGCRGNREWTEYALVTLLAMVTVLVPLLLVQLALLAYTSGSVGADGVLLPWTVWLAGLLACSVWQACMPQVGVSGDPLSRTWRREGDRGDSASDTELLPRLPGGVV